MRRTRSPWERNNAVVLGDLRPARAPGADLRTRVEVLAAGMSFVLLLLTCGNVANFLLVRGLGRDREFVVKTALGASRGRLFREVLVEAGLLAAAAADARLFPSIRPTPQWTSAIYVPIERVPRGHGR